MKEGVYPLFCEQPLDDLGLSEWTQIATSAAIVANMLMTGRAVAYNVGGPATSFVDFTAHHVFPVGQSWPPGVPSVK